MSGSSDYYEPMVGDIQAAADVLRPCTSAPAGADGFASMRMRMAKDRERADVSALERVGDPVVTLAQRDTLDLEDARTRRSRESGTGS